RHARRFPRASDARALGGHVARPRHPDDRGVHQPSGRRPARRARPEAEARLTAMPLLEIKNLTVEFAVRHGHFRAVDGVSLSLEPGEIVSIVGESGSGKSVAM